MMLIILAMVYASTLAFDFRPRLRDSAKGEKVLYLALMVVSLVPLVMNVLSLLFCLIQALVFTMLLSIYIAEAAEEE